MSQLASTTASTIVSTTAPQKLKGFGVSVPEFDVAFDLEHLSPTIGSIISGVDLRQKQSQTIIDDIRKVFVERKVIFFRDQDLTTEQHIDFARRFGELEIHPFAPQKEGFPQVLGISHGEKSKGQENSWHSDVTWREVPPLGSILRALEVPDVGGDTLFSCMETAYDKLSDELKEKLEGRTATHDFTHFRERMKKRGKTDEEIEAFNRKYPVQSHPVIRTHPETGRKSIYVNASFTLRIDDMSEIESKEILTFLYRQAAYPEYQCRFRWQKNSIAFWDNRSCQHYAASDYWPAVRRMERVTIIGDRPA